MTRLELLCFTGFCRKKVRRHATRVKTIPRRVPDTGCPMPSHKFNIGETVRVRAAIGRNVPGGVYEVTRQLPHNGSEFEYRIKSANEEHERVARESELTRV